jgi:hypothetical protein
VHAHAFDHSANTLQIRIPAAAAGVVRVTDHVAERRPLAANLASHCHGNSSPVCGILDKVSSLAEFCPIRTGFDALAVGQPAREDARSVPKNTGQNGRYKTVLVGAGVVEAARLLGGQPFAPQNQTEPLPILSVRAVSRSSHFLELWRRNLAIRVGVCSDDKAVVSNIGKTLDAQLRSRH